MLTNQTIKEFKKEWTTWNKNIPSRLNHSNINEFRGYLGKYRQRLDMGLTLFNDEIKQLHYQANNKHNPETYNPRLADLYDEWRKEVSKVWWDFILSIGDITNSLFDYSPKKATNTQEKIQRLKELHPDTDWDMYFLKNPEPTQDELNQQAMEKLLKRLKTDKARAERKWRAFAKKLKDFVVWSDSWGVSDKIVVQTNQQIEETTIKGVPFKFIGDPYKAHKGVDFLNDLHNTTIPLFVKRMREVMPLMQKMIIPFHVHFQKTHECGNNAAGCYEYTHIDITNWGITGNPRETIKILAHEMGHHIWQSFVKKEAQVFWSNALKGDLGEVDMEEVIQAWDRAGKRDSKLKVNNPIIYLQVAGLLYSPFYSNKGVVGVSHAINLYREGKLERFIQVPTTPITGYAQKNSEEAFCEALGLLVAYGGRTVHEKIKALLQIILPNQIKTGSYKQDNLDFSTKTTPTSVFVEVKDQGEVVGLARAYGDTISMMEVAHTYQCSDDLIDISYEYPQVMDGENIRILEVNVASLNKDYRGQGIGLQMYRHMVEGWKKQTRKSFVIIPEKCSTTGFTSEMALRVWNSLKKEHPSSGLCVVIDL